MTWGPYYFFYDCPACGKHYRWMTDDMDEDTFGECPVCHIQGKLVGETRDVVQGEDKFADYEYI